MVSKTKTPDFLSVCSLHRPGQWGARPRRCQNKAITKARSELQTNSKGANPAIRTPNDEIFEAILRTHLLKMPPPN